MEDKDKSEKRKKTDKSFYATLRFLGVLSFLWSLAWWYVLFTETPSNIGSEFLETLFGTIIFTIVSIILVFAENAGNRYKVFAKNVGHRYKELNKKKNFRSFQVGLFSSFVIVFFLWIVLTSQEEITELWDKLVSLFLTVLVIIFIPISWVFNFVVGVGLIPILLIIIIYLLLKVVNNQRDR